MIEAATDYLVSPDNSRELSVAMCLLDAEVKRQAGNDLNHAVRLTRKAIREAFNQQRQVPGCLEHQ